MPKAPSDSSALYRYLATSEDAVPRRVRAARRSLQNFELVPNPALLRAALYAYRAARSAREFGMRVLVCQPLFRASCKECGPNLRTGDFVHFIQGEGDIIVGSNVWLDGKSSITFAARFSDRPTLIIGDNSGFGHDTELVIAQRISIGKNTNISGATRIFDSSGHPADPAARRNHDLPRLRRATRDHRGRRVDWEGLPHLPGSAHRRRRDCLAGSVVRKHVPPYAVVAGNPAQVVFRLPRPDQDGVPRGD